MRYSKVIHYGDTLELYQYEKFPTVGQRTSRKIKTATYLQDIFLSGVYVSEEPVEPKKVRSPFAISRALLDFKRLVSANIDGVNNPLLITLTYAENVTDIRRARKDFKAFADRIRNVYGSTIRYVAVPERQARGAIHFHALFWGLPVKTASNERKSRLVASLWRKGFVDIIKTDGSKKLAHYLIKYLSKTLSFLPSSIKSYIASRSILRPTIERNAVLAPYYYNEATYDLSTAKTIQDKTYMTKWLGKGRYRLFIQPKPQDETNRNI